MQEPDGLRLGIKKGTVVTKDHEDYSIALVAEYLSQAETIRSKVEETTAAPLSKI
jgi:hypothetical protein